MREMLLLNCNNLVPVRRKHNGKILNAELESGQHPVLLRDRTQLGMDVAKVSSKENEKGNEKGNEKEPDKKYRSKAEEYLNDPEKTEELIKKARSKMQDKNSGPLKEVWESLSALCRLVMNYVRGNYRETPWYSIVMMVAAIVYFVSPIDAIFDAIPILGYVDDAGVIAWTVKTFKDDIETFVEWEAEQDMATS